PGMSAEEVRGELAQRVAATLEGTGLSVEVRAMLGAVPPLSTPPEASIVKLAERLTGKPAGSVAFATEGPYLSSMGLDTIVLGAGDIDVAHQPDEHVALDRLAPMERII